MSLIFKSILLQKEARENGKEVVESIGTGKTMLVFAKGEKEKNI